MSKVSNFIKEVAIVIYKIGYIIFLLLRKLYKYLKRQDYKGLSHNLGQREFLIKHKFLLAAILGLVMLPFIVSSFRNDDGGIGIGIFQSTTMNKVITNELSDLEETKRLDRDIESFMRKWEIVGGSLAIMKNDKLVYCKGYGYADKDNEELCDVKHIFRVASVSKLITAVAIMKLSEDGKLKLNDKVFGEEGLFNDARFLEISDKRIKNITIEHLLRHSAGFSTRNGDPMFNQALIASKLNIKPPFSLDDVLEYGSKSRLRFKPGEGYNYSNLGYVILSKVIEKATGMDYEEYVREKILAPSGCHDMHIAYNNTKDKYKNEVRYYEPSNEVQFEDEDGNLIPKSDGGNNVRLLGGAGGWVGSPMEILKFVASIDMLPGVEDILSEKSILYMTAPKSGQKPIGWINTRGAEWTRTGSMAGTSAIIKRQSNGYTWMFVSNTSSWKGARFPAYISSSVKKALSSVEKWPRRDIFQIADSIMGN